MRHHGSPGDNLVGFEAAVHSRTSGDHHLISDDDVVCKACLSTDHDVMPYASTAGNPDLCHQDRMGTDRHVMGDLDQIVDLGALLDDRLTKCGSINRDIRPDLDVILDRDSPKLGNFVMLSLVLHIAESVASNHRAAVNDHPRANRAAFPDHNVGIEQRIISDRCIVADKHTWIEYYSRTNRDPVSQGDSRPDRDILSDVRVNASDDGRGNTARRGDRAKKGLGNLRKGQCGISDDDVRSDDFSKPSVGKERSGCGGSTGLEHPISCDEGQIIRACLFKTCQMCNGRAWRSHKLSADNLVDLCQ